jgi:hypothetical protein
MDGKEIENKYKKEIEYIRGINEDIKNTLDTYKKDIEKSLDSLKKIEGHFRYYPKEKIDDSELIHWMAEVFGHIWNIHKTFGLFYEEIINNKLMFNEMSLWIKVFWDKFNELEGMEDIKEKLQDFTKRIIAQNQNKNDLKVVKEINAIMNKMLKRQEDLKKQRGIEIA